MEAINWLLINAGNLVQWLWASLKAFFTTVGSAVDAALNPILSRVLTIVNPVCTAVADGVYAALSPLPAWLGLTVLSVVAGVVMLLVFRYTSNQAAIGRARDQITANLLALKLFKDDLGVTFRSQGRLLGALLRLQWHMLRPVLIMLVPFLLALAQMGLRYQWRPLRPGERTLIKLRLSSANPEPTEARLEANPGLIVEAGPVPGGGELVWRVRAAQPGRHVIVFHISGHQVQKEVVVGDRFRRVSAERVGRHWTSQLLHPAEPVLPPGCPVQSITVGYGGVDSRIYGSNWWILYFFLVSMGSALLLRPLFRVRF